MRTDRALLTIAAVLESLTGLSLLLAPRPIVVLLLSAAPDSVGMMIGRVAGLALLALGLACWGAAADSGGAARSATFNAMTLYNLGVGALLVTFAALGKASGFIVWGVGLLHLGLGAGFAASPRDSEKGAR